MSCAVSVKRLCLGDSLLIFNLCLLLAVVFSTACGRHDVRGVLWTFAPEYLLQ